MQIWVIILFVAYIVFEITISGFENYIQKINNKSKGEDHERNKRNHSKDHRRVP